MRNAFIDKWHGREAELAAIQEGELAKVEAAYEAGNYDTANVTVGESIWLVRDIPAGRRTGSAYSAEATARLSLGRQNQFLGAATGAAAERTRPYRTTSHTI